MGEFARSHRQVWYQHWLQQTNINFTTHLSKFSGLPNLEEIHTIFLFYVEMISSIILRPEDQTVVQIAPIMESASRSFDFLTREMKDPAVKKDQRLEKKLSNLRKQLNVSVRNAYPQLLWTYVEFWLETDRNQLYQNLCENNLLSKSVKEFFNLIFYHTFVALTQRYSHV
jgi:hypothetical protein